MKKTIPDVPAHWQQANPSDEIDLRELIMVLWRQKVLILLVTGLFAAAGIAYALLAPQLWSANAVVVAPGKKDLLPLERVASQAKLLGLTGFPDRKELYGEFTQEFNAYDNRREYLENSQFFKDAVAMEQLDDKKQRHWIRDWAKTISADAVDKKGEIPGTTLVVGADTSKKALDMLKEYTDFIIAKQKQRLISDLMDQKSVKLETLTLDLKLMREDTERSLKQDINATTVAIAMAKAAGVERPLENYTDSSRFSITLGSKGLEEKLKMLKSADLNVIQPKLVGLQNQIALLQQVSLDSISFRPFSYLEAPEEPLSRDKPKRPLIVVLATLLGGMLGVGIVLVRHAFRKPEEA